ncbi:OLC1v1016352C1 [Oldenlandia corymbosa var. corymbosa]|uniref:OLC1v1016352C1 n=1 Tax=Oldenlandia corymbosa var. corymbosa TaxID=529605 RepID=A0AAV1E7E0_OLDCO|nr:OLC1v1016352C1 [Oldenlandia corymbosa var. corymbosa]
MELQGIGSMVEVTSPIQQAIGSMVKVTPPIQSMVEVTTPIQQAIGSMDDVAPPIQQAIGLVVVEVTPPIQQANGSLVEVAPPIQQASEDQRSVEVVDTEPSSSPPAHQTLVVHQILAANIAPDVAAVTEIQHSPANLDVVAGNGENPSSPVRDGRLKSPLTKEDQSHMPMAPFAQLSPQQPSASFASTDEPVNVAPSTEIKKSNPQNIQPPSDPDFPNLNMENSN